MATIYPEVGIIRAGTGREAYAYAVEHVLTNGIPRTARDRKTLDAGFTSLVLDSPLDALPLGLGRNLSKAVAAIEALQLIGAFSVPALVVKIAPRFANYQENGGYFHGAYGTRIRHQMLNVASKLRGDEGTRRAVVTLWDPVLDNQPGKKDYPCTIMLQFEVQHGRLSMNVVMRSSDVFLGLPYDLFQFSQLQMTLARSLGLAWGTYRHTALSTHIYEADLGAARRVEFPRNRDPYPDFQPLGIGGEGDSFTKIMQRASMLISPMGLANSTSEAWYRDALAPFLG